MKTCTNCGLEFEDRYFFCTQDGSRLSTNGEPADDIFAPTRVPGSNLTPPAAPVLYCPACGGEYPLSFSTCPVDAIELTPEGITVSKHLVTQEVDNAAAGGLPDVLHAGVEIRADSGLSSGEPEPSQDPRIPDQDLQANPDPDFGWTGEHGVESNIPDSLPVGDEVFTSRREETLAERPGLRVAAIMIAAGLVVFALVALYTFLRSTSHKRSAPAFQTSAQATRLEDSILVPTPQSARDYAEPSRVAKPGGSEQSTGAGQAERPVEQPTSRTEGPKATARVAAPRPAQPVRSSNERGRAEPEASAASPKRGRAAPQPIRNDEAYPVLLTQAGDRLISARAVRVHASRIPAGFRYDLTFSLHELAGHPLSWERLLITTRAVSGLSRSQVIPFSHRLGAAGTLTFTVGVELRGSREPDWRGRVLCTGLGSYDSGRLIRTSFGTEVSP